MLTAETLKKRRAALQLSQDALAQLLMRNRATINRWERGATIPHWVEAQLQTIEHQATPADSTETLAVYLDDHGRHLSAQARALLPPGAYYWKAEPGGEWSQWQRAEHGYSDSYTGQTRAA